MQNQQESLGFDLNHLAGVWVLLVVFVLFTITGCSGSSKRAKVAKEIYEAERPAVVMTSLEDKRPSWTKASVYEDLDSGKVCFSGGFLNGSDYSVTIRCANAEALKVAAQSISQFIRTEFSSYIEGSNTGSGGVSRYVSDGIATFVDNLHMQGIRQAEIYYEENFSPAVMQPTYNVWVRLEVSQIDYLQAKAEAIKRLRDRFADAGEWSAKEKADRILEQLKEQIHEAA